MLLAAELAQDIIYDVEPEQSIPAARNHALRLAQGNYIAIIDDDEFPGQEWLTTMYRALQVFEVDGCLGPVHPFFEQEPPAWLLKSRFCERPVHRTGTLLHWSQTRTGNVLIKKEVFDKRGLSFDCKLKTGGSDHEFFKQAIAAGCRFIAVAEAPVYEIVPPERWTRRYYLKRALVNGFNANRNSLSETHGLHWVAVFAKAAAALLAYTLVTPFCACLGAYYLMNCLERGAHNLSRLCAILGIELVKRRNF
jgi:succinoglycan biosynthesis protein ExoM